MGVLFKKALKDIDVKNVRTLLSLLTMALGTASIVGVNVAIDSTVFSLVRSFEILGIPEASYYFKGMVPESRVLNVLTTYRTLVNIWLGIEIPGSIRGLTNTYVLVIGTDLLRYPNVNGFYLTKGSLDEFLKGGKICVIDEHFAKLNGLKIGDTLTLYFFFEKKGLCTLKVKVVGLCRSPRFVEQLIGFTYLYVPLTTLRRTLELSDEVNVLHVTLKREDHHVVERISRRLFSEGLVHHEEVKLNEVRELVESVKPFISFAQLLSLAATLIGSILIASNVGMNVIERRREVGILKVLGATNFQLLKLYVVETLILSLIACSAGLIMGCLTPLLVYRELCELASLNKLVYVLRPETLLTSLALSVGIALPTSLYPSWLAWRTNVAGSLRTRGELIKVPSFISRGPLVLRMALRSPFRRVTDYLILISLLSITTAVLGGMGILVESSIVSFNKYFDKVWRTDLMVIFFQPVDVERLKAAITKIKHVKEVSRIAWCTASHGNNVFSVIGIDPRSGLVKPMLTAGVELDGRGGILLTSSLARSLGVGIGDRVRLTISGKAKELKVVGLIKDLLSGGKVAYVSLEDLEDVNGLSYGLLIKALNPLQVGKKVSVLVRGLAIVGIKELLEAEVRRQITYYAAFGYAISYFTLLASFVGVLCISSALTLRRLKEIAILKVLGATVKQLIVSHLIESFLVGALGVLIGLLVAPILGLAFITALSAQLPFIDFTLNIAGLVKTAILVLLISILGFMLPLTKGLRSRIVEVLRSPLSLRV